MPGSAGGGAGGGGLGPGGAGRARLPGKPADRAAGGAVRVDAGQAREAAGRGRARGRPDRGGGRARARPGDSRRVCRTARNSSASRKNGRRRGSGSRPVRAAFREEREDGWLRPHPRHPWLDPAVTGDPGHVPARQGVAVDGKERKGAKAGGQKKVHLLAAVTRVPGIVIAQDKVAKAGKANEITHFKAAAGPAAA